MQIDHLRTSAVAAIALAGAGFATDAAAQFSSDDIARYRRECAAVGGMLNTSTGTCEGAGSGGSGGGGGYTAQQQAMLNLAGQFGTLLGQAIAQSFQDAARQAEVNRIQREWAAQQARERAAAAAEEQRRRNQALLANMRGTVGSSELTMRGTGSGGELRMRTVEDMDREAAARPPQAPASSDDPQDVLNAYSAALQARNDALHAYAVAASDLAAANDLVAGARRAIADQRAAVEALPAGSEERAVAEARLAEMETALAEATRIRDQAEARVAAASAASGRAEQAFAAAEAGRNRLGEGATLQTTSAAPPPEPHTDTSVVDLRDPPAQQLVYDPVRNSVYYADGSVAGAQQLALPRMQEVENSPGREAWLAGMTAAARHDWQTAEAMFREAQARDPSNQALARAVSLAEWQRTASARQGGTAVVRPSDSDLELLFADAAPRTSSGAVQRPADADLELLFDQTNQSIGDLYQTYTMEAAGREASQDVATAAHRAHARDLAGQALARLGSGERGGVPEAIALLDAAAREAPEVPNYASARDTLRQTWERTTAASTRIERAAAGGPNN